MNAKDLLKGIDTVIVRVKNLDASRKWYTEQIGLREIWHDEQLKLSVLDTGGPTSLTLWHTTGDIRIQAETASYPIFGTVDAVALRLLLLDQGIKVGSMEEDEHTKYFFFYDPDGNVLEACEVRDK